METEGKISYTQAAFLTYASAMGNIIYTFTEVAYIAGRAFWMATLFGVLLNIPFAIWILFLGYYKQSSTLFDLLQDGLGAVVAKGLLILYVLINMITSVCMLNLFSGSVKVFVLPRTPSLVIMLLLILLCALFVKSGLKYFARLTVVLSVLSGINFFSGFSLSLFKDFRFEYISPIFDTTLPRFLIGTFVAAGNDMECLLFLMVFVSSMPKTRNHLKAIVKGIIAWSLVLTSAEIIMEGIVSPEILSQIGASGITVASDLLIGSFLSGIESFVLISFQYTAVYKIVLLLYCGWEAAKKLFNSPKGHPLLYAIALAVLVAAVFINSFNRSYYLALFVGSYIVPPFVLLVLILGSISSFIVRRKNEKKQKE